jgi:hypothetical protein
MKITHFKGREAGEKVLALCSTGEAARPINLRLATWTIIPSAVTCKRCKRIVADQKFEARR